MYKTPKNQKAWTVYYDLKHTPRFIMTSDMLRTTFTLYRIENDKLTKLGSGKNPIELEKEFKIMEELKQ